MKKLLLSGLGMCIAILALCQDPVNWTFTAKKIADKTYEVQITASIAAPWSIYSKDTPEGGPLGTTVSFAKNPLTTLSGKVKEQGSLQKKHEEVFGVDVLYYKSKVVFTQTIVLKKPVKTNLSGSVEFMACNNEQCLPPKTIPFSILLN